MDGVRWYLISMDVCVIYKNGGNAQSVGADPPLLCSPDLINSCSYPCECDACRADDGYERAATLYGDAGDEEERLAFLDKVFEMGCTFWDTAEV